MIIIISAAKYIIIIIIIVVVIVKHFEYLLNFLTIYGRLGLLGYCLDMGQLGLYDERKLFPTIWYVEEKVFIKLVSNC